MIKIKFSLSRCYTGFTGSNCSNYDCSGVDDCSGNGTCVEPNLCLCNEGYDGGRCLTFTCEALSRCSGKFHVFSLILFKLFSTLFDFINDSYTQYYFAN